MTFEEAGAHYAQLQEVRPLFEDSRHRHWFGPEHDGVAIRHNGATRVLTREGGLAGAEVKRVVEDDGGVWWLASESGITRIQGGL